MDSVTHTVPVRSAKNRRTAAKDKLVHRPCAEGPVFLRHHHSPTVDSDFCIFFLLGFVFQSQDLF